MPFILLPKCPPVSFIEHMPGSDQLVGHEQLRTGAGSATTSSLYIGVADGHVLLRGYRRTRYDRLGESFPTGVAYVQRMPARTIQVALIKRENALGSDQLVGHERLRIPLGGATTASPNMHHRNTGNRRSGNCHVDLGRGAARIREPMARPNVPSSSPRLASLSLDERLGPKRPL